MGKFSAKFVSCLTIFVFFGGCKKVERPSYLDLQEVCELKGAGQPLIDTQGTLEVSAACSEAVGNLVGIQWDSFGEEPSSFQEPDTLAQSIVGGVLLLISYNGVSVESTLGAEAPLLLFEYLSSIKNDQNLSSGDDVGRLLYFHLLETVDRIEYNPDASLDAYYGNKTITIGPREYSEDDVVIRPDDYPPLPFLEASTIVIHESAHYLYKKHIDCTLSDKVNCDYTREGPHGVAAWWGYLWILHNQEYVDYPTCRDEANFIYYSCGSILSDSEWLPCRGDDALYEICHG